MDEMNLSPTDHAIVILERRQQRIVAAIVADALEMIDRIIEDKYRDAALDHEARMLYDMDPLELVNAETLETKLLAQLAQWPTPEANDDGEEEARRRKRRRFDDRRGFTASWNISASPGDQTAVAQAAGAPSSVGGFTGSPL